LLGFGCFEEAFGPQRFAADLAQCHARQPHLQTWPGRKMLSSEDAIGHASHAESNIMYNPVMHTVEDGAHHDRIKLPTAAHEEIARHTTILAWV